jgi:hypothetical protein
MMLELIAEFASFGLANGFAAVTRDALTIAQDG